MSQWFPPDAFTKMLLFICLFGYYVCCAQGQTVVDTEYGQVRGHLVNVNNGVQQTAVEAFYGIPFAKPPVGSLRFASPERPDPWTGILEGDTLGDVCPQNMAFVRTTNPQWPDERVSEDCLHLNIYTPTEGSGPFPVMVWMFGGAYQVGANVQYPGHFLASRGVIVVTINYRVNKFGFAYTGNDACPGNAGVLDQNTGLQFVVDNIGNFGGNPTRITVFGESAGSTSSSLHMLSPMSKGLFQQAIMESGSELNFWGLNTPASNPADYTRQIAEDLDCIRSDDYQMIDCLRSLSWQNILENSTSDCTPGYMCLGMAPVVDGPGGFMPDTPANLRAAGDVMSGPIISGICKEDGSIFTPLIAPAVVLDDCCNRTYFSYVLEKSLVGYFESRLSNTTMDDVYHALDYEYTPWPYIYNNTENRHRLVDVVTDASFGVFWDRQLKEQSELAPTFGYVFDRTVDFAFLDEWIGTPHAAEVTYVWGNTLLHFNEEVMEDSMTSGLVNYTTADEEYTMFVQELWTNFAKFGTPTPSPVDNPLGGSSITWPQFSFDDMNVLYMGASDIRVEKEWQQKVYAFWSQYLIWMAGDELAIGSAGSIDVPFEVVDALNVGFRNVMANGRLEQLMKEFVE